VALDRGEALAAAALGDDPLEGGLVLRVQDVAAGDVVGLTVDCLGTAQTASDRGCFVKGQVVSGNAAFDQEASKG
jgi:hypothetical protein